MSSERRDSMPAMGVRDVAAAGFVFAVGLMFQYGFANKIQGGEPKSGEWRRQTARERFPRWAEILFLDPPIWLEAMFAVAAVALLGYIVLAVYRDREAYEERVVQIGLAENLASGAVAAFTALAVAEGLRWFGVASPAAFTSAVVLAALAAWLAGPRLGQRFANVVLEDESDDTIDESRPGDVDLR